MSVSREDKISKIKTLPIVVVGYNNLDYTEKCLESIFKHTTIPYTLIVVDNGSTDDTSLFLKEQAKEHLELVVLTSKTNLGFAGGYNMGMKYAFDNLDFDHLLIMNNDVIVTPGYVESMLNTFELGKKAGIKQIGSVGPVSNYVSGSQNIKIPDINTDEDLIKFSEAHKAENKDKFFVPPFLIGFVVLYTREALAEVGFFDEVFYPGNWEDTDHTVRMRRAGYIPLVSRETFIYHYGSKTVVELYKTYPKSFYENKDRFFNKWIKLDRIGEKKKIIGACRVKNGAQYLNETMEAVSRMCDEIVIFDDHSTDETESICKAYPNVHYYKSKWKTFNEARDRNFLTNKAAELGGDWIYLFDADEVPEERLINGIQDLVNIPDPQCNGFIFHVLHFWDSPKFVRMDGVWGGCMQCRLYRVFKNQEIIANSEDGLHCGSHYHIPIEQLRYTRFYIKHYGNMEESVRKAKYDWYNKTDTDKDLGCILGGFQDYYKQLYYGDTKATIKDEDAYRHLIDDRGKRLIPWIENNGVSVCVIAKNEGNYIRDMLESVKTIADELIVTIDADSTDDTEKICIEYTSKIYKYKFNRSGFSGMRNYCLSKATKPWILFVDGDEVLDTNMPQAIHNAILRADIDAYLCSFKNWQDGEVEGKSQWVLSENFRLFRNIPEIYYTGIIHEDISPSLELSRLKTGRLDLGYIGNRGYIKDPEVVKQKHAFYNKLLEQVLKDDPTNYRAMLHYAIYLLSIKDWDTAESYYRKVLELRPDQWRAQAGLATVLYKKSIDLSKLSEAQRYFQLALSGIKIDKLADQGRIQQMLQNLNGVNNLRKSAM